MGVKENTHQFIMRIENQQMFLELIQKGFISLNILNYKVYYERFLLEFAIMDDKVQAVVNASEEYNVSTKTIERAIKYMEC